MSICFHHKDPCIVFEPKTLYRAAVEEVPDESFQCEIGKADILRTGKDVTLIGWGTQVHVLQEVADMAKKELKIDCEVIDLVSILPWDKETVCQVSDFLIYWNTFHFNIRQTIYTDFVDI